MCRVMVFIFIMSAFFFSCTKADKVEAELKGVWEMVILKTPKGSQQWTFTSDNKLHIRLSNIDTVVTTGTFNVEIVNYSHGKLLNKNIFKVASVTIQGLKNYIYTQGANIYFPAYNTRWEVHQLDKEILILTTDEYDGISGGLEIREFIRID